MLEWGKVLHTTIRGGPLSMMTSFGTILPETPIVPEETSGSVIAASFADRTQAHDAAQRLHAEGFTSTWIGVARQIDVYDAVDAAGAALPSQALTQVESDSWLGRLLGDGGESLGEALMRHGVAEADAIAAGMLPPAGAVLTVDGMDAPRLAAHLIEELRGTVITSRSIAQREDDVTLDTTRPSQAAVPRTTSLREDGVASQASQPTPVPLAVENAAGIPANDVYGAADPLMVDESTRLQLEDAPLRVDRSPLGARTDAMRAETTMQTWTGDRPAPITSTTTSTTIGRPTDD
jgi:hypothetical protein